MEANVHSEVTAKAVASQASDLSQQALKEIKAHQAAFEKQCKLSIKAAIASVVLLATSLLLGVGVWLGLSIALFYTLVELTVPWVVAVGMVSTLNVFIIFYLMKTRAALSQNINIFDFKSQLTSHEKSLM